MNMHHPRIHLKPLNINVWSTEFSPALHREALVRDGVSLIVVFTI